MDAILKMDHPHLTDIFILDIMGKGKYQQIIRDFRVGDTITREFLIKLAVAMGQKPLDINLDQDMIVNRRRWGTSMLIIGLKRGV